MESIQSQGKVFKACDLGTKLGPILIVTNLQVLILCKKKMRLCLQLQSA